ncbi:unnamed protein product, partial [Penicillium salamii]
GGRRNSLADPLLGCRFSVIFPPLSPPPPPPPATTSLNTCTLLSFLSSSSTCDIRCLCGGLSHISLNSTYSVPSFSRGILLCAVSTARASLVSAASA